MTAPRAPNRPALFRALTAWVTGGDMDNHTRHRNVQGEHRARPSSERATG